MKSCSRCRVCKPLDEFHRRSATASGLASRCKSCQSVTARGEQMWVKYRIRPAQYDEMVSSQMGACAICGDEGKLVVDHDHKCCSTEKTCGGCLRGLLCPRCNAGIGQLREDPEILRAAMAYLEQYSPLGASVQPPAKPNEGA